VRRCGSRPTRRCFRLDDDRFTARIERRWWVVRGPNGGYLAAILLRALEARVGDPARRPRSLTVHYLAPPAEGDATVETRVEREGRSVTTLSARLVQDGRTMALALAAFASARRGPAFRDRRMPEVPPPTALARREPVGGQALPMAEQVVAWPAIGPPPFSGAPESVTGGWLRLADPEPLDHPQLALLTDAWLPAVFSRMTVPAAVPTVDLTIHFREPIPADPDPEACYLGVFGATVGAEGFVEEDGEIWSPDGRLLAQSRQLCLAVGG
jgi:acyl-CoA thioesterase